MKGFEKGHPEFRKKKEEPNGEVKMEELKVEPEKEMGLCDQVGMIDDRVIELDENIKEVGERIKRIENVICPPRLDVSKIDAAIERIDQFIELVKNVSQEQSIQAQQPSVQPQPEQPEPRPVAQQSGTVRVEVASPFQLGDYRFSVGDIVEFPEALATNLYKSGRVRQIR